MVVGIDFGTANTSIAILDGNRPVAILDCFGSSRFPVPGEDEHNSFFDGTVLLLRHNKKIAEEKTGRIAHTAVLAIPVTAGDSYIRKLSEAGKKAGFLHVKILSQPEATALSVRKNLSGKILILDFGERTCKSSLLEVHPDRIELQSSIMDDSLGGSRFTRDICALIKKKAGLNSERTGRAYSIKLKEIAENLKKGLSAAEELTISLHGKPITVTRREYENYIEPKLTRLEKMVERLLCSSGNLPSKIDTIFLVGGGSHTPCIKTSARNLFPESVCIRMCPAEAAALGAAGFFTNMQGLPPKTMSLSPYDFGIEIDRGKTFWMLHKDTVLPVSEKRVFTTVADNQNRVEIHILQRCGQKTGCIISLRRIELGNIPPAPQGRPRIAVQFSLDRKGLLTITIKGPVGEVSETVRISASGPEEKNEHSTQHDIDTLISRVEKEYAESRYSIDPGFSEDINGILEIARSGKTLDDPGLKRECTIALWSILKEMEFAAENREAGFAG